MIVTRSLSTTTSLVTSPRPKDDTVSESDTYQQESVAGLTKVNPEIRVTKVKKIKMNGVEITPSTSMTYLGIILDQKLNWSLHIKTKVSKAIKFLAMIKPAIDYIYGLSPARMLWIYKQILLPRITYGSHVWGHSLTPELIGYVRKAERLALRYFAPMWKTTPTASLEVILNQKPSYLEIEGMAIKTYIQIKDEFQNNIWDGVPLNARANSHLRKLKSITTGIKHEGQPLADFVSDNLKILYFNWNPPAQNALVAVCDNDIDDQNEIDDFKSCESTSQNNNDCTLPAELQLEVLGDSQQQHDQDVAVVPAEQQLEVHSYKQQQLHDNDVAVVPAEQQLKVQGDRQQQHDKDVAVVPAEQQLEVQCDRQQQHDKDIAVVPAEQQLEVLRNKQQKQQHDKDVAVVPAEQQLEVLSDRQQQQQHENDIAVVSAEQQLEVQSDRLQQQQPDSVLAIHCVEEHLHVNGNGQVATINHPGEKHSQLFDCNNTPKRIPAGI